MNVGEGHPVAPRLFIGQPQHDSIRSDAMQMSDPLQAALMIHEGQTVYVPDEETARRTLKILGAADEHIQDRLPS